MRSLAITARKKPALRPTMFALALACAPVASCVSVDEETSENADSSASTDTAGHDEADHEAAADALKGATMAGHAQIAPDGGFYQRPAVSIKLALMRDGKILQTVATGAHGEFYFTAKLSSSIYRIVVQESLYRGTLTVKVPGQALKDLLIKVQRTEIVP